MKHAQRTEKYIRLIFNSYISDDDFLKVHAHYRHKLDFFWRFSRPRGLNTVTEILLKVALNTIKQTQHDIIISNYGYLPVDC